MRLFQKKGRSRERLRLRREEGHEPGIAPILAHLHAVEVWGCLPHIHSFIPSGAESVADL